MNDNGRFERRMGIILRHIPNRQDLQGSDPWEHYETAKHRAAGIARGAHGVRFDAEFYDKAIKRICEHLGV